MGLNIFEKYGIKEVANVSFIALETDAAANVYAGDVVLYLDTLKVSTIEQTAESVDARGGWGNPKLITWNYGKEITVTLEDALMSLESLKFMMGGSAIRHGTSATNDSVTVHRTETVKVKDDKSFDMPVDHLTKKTITKIPLKNGMRVLNLTQGWRTQIAPDSSAELTEGGMIEFFNKAMGIGSAEEGQDTSYQDCEPGDILRLFWDEVYESSTERDQAVEIVISPDTYPGTYKIVGDTFMRNSKGKDEAFQFVIGKAKVSSDVTLTLEAEGDPSTFSMTLTVLKDESDARGDQMMQLIRYYSQDTESSNKIEDYGSLTATGIAISGEPEGTANQTPKP